MNEAQSQKDVGFANFGWVCYFILTLCFLKEPDMFSKNNSTFFRFSLDIFRRNFH